MSNSFAISAVISAITAITAYSFIPIGVVIDTIPAAVEETALAVVVVMVLVSIIYTHLL
jgi:hypothetical protein